MQVQEGVGVDPFIGTPTPGPVNRQASPVAVSGIQNSQSNGSSVNPGAFVAAAVAVLTLVLVSLFVVRRHRNSSADSQSKHREFTDDEDDLGHETDENTAMSPAGPVRKSYVVSDNSLEDSFYSGRSGGEGQEIYKAVDRSRQQRDFRYEPHDECSSPNCEACEMKRRSGTKFVAADTGIQSLITQDLPPREYEADDTVSL